MRGCVASREGQQSFFFDLCGRLRSSPVTTRPLMQARPSAHKHERTETDSRFCSRLAHPPILLFRNAFQYIAASAVVAPMIA